MLDEGTEHVLDLIQETAAIDTIFVYSHSYGGDVRKPLNVLATDHGMPPKDQRTRNLPNVWVKQHDQYFRDTALRHPKVDASFDYHDRDLFDLVCDFVRRGADWQRLKGLGMVKGSARLPASRTSCG